MKEDTTTTEEEAAHGDLAEALLELRELASSGSLEMGIIDEALGKAGIRPWIAKGFPDEEDEESPPARVNRGITATKYLKSIHESHCLSCGEVETDADGLCELCLKCSLCCPCGTYD